MIAIRPFTEEWTGAVREFNTRVAGTGFDYPPVPAPGHFLAVEDAHMRGGYILGRQRFWLRGKALDVAHYRLPVVEGLGADGKLSALQQAFVEEDAMQCGYCTSGMLISAAALLDRQPAPAEDEIRDALTPNLCRCGVQLRAIRAVQRAAGAPQPATADAP